MHYPKRIQDCRNAWLYQKIWKRIFKRNGQFALVICGRTGSGKSYLAVEIIHRLVGEKWDVEKFTVFSAEQFSALVAQPLPKGTAILFDDSGLAALSGDALTTEVKNLSKIFQSVRSRGFIIILTLPSLFLLATSVKSQLDFYAEPLFIDFEKELCHSKFQGMQTNPKKNHTYFSNMIKFVKTKSELTGLESYEKQKLSSIAFDKAPQVLLDRYEVIKSQRVMDFNKEAHQTIKAKKDKAKKKTLTSADVAKLVSKKKDDFIKNGKVSSEMIALKYNIGINRSKQIAKMVDSV